MGQYSRKRTSKRDSKEEKRPEHGACSGNASILVLPEHGGECRCDGSSAGPKQRAFHSWSYPGDKVEPSRDF